MPLRNREAACEAASGYPGADTSQCTQIEVGCLPTGADGNVYSLARWRATGQSKWQCLTWFFPWGDVEFWWTVRESHIICKLYNYIYIIHSIILYIYIHMSLIFQAAFMHRNRWNGQPWFLEVGSIYGEWLQHEADEHWHIRLRSLKSLHPCAIHLYYLRSTYIRKVYINHPKKRTNSKNSTNMYIYILYIMVNK